jgi:hypothetical protein
MKSKNSPNLFEILSSAASKPSTPASAPPEARSAPVDAAPEPGLQERLAAYKAAKLAMLTAPPPQAPAAVAFPDPPPPPAPAATAVQSGPVSSPGERMVRLTWNTAAFLGLVIVGLLSIAYALGVRAGRASAAGEPAPEPSPALAAPPRAYAILVGEWPCSSQSAQERMKSKDAAEQAKAALDRAGHRGAEKVLIRRGGKDLLALYLGRFTNPASEEATKKLAAVRGLAVRGQRPFAQAQFEELPK